MRSTTLSTSSRTPTLHGGGGNESGSDGGQVALMLALDAAFVGLARYGAKPLASPRTLVWLAVDTQPNEFPGTAVPTWTLQAVSNSLVSVSWLVSFITWLNLNVQRLAHCRLAKPQTLALEREPP